MLRVLKLYIYQGCSTCRAAVKWLKDAGVDFTEIPIREAPPPVAELRAALAAQGGNLGRLVNSSGMDYRSLGLKDVLPGLSTDAALKLLSGNGNLIKRPFAVDADRGVYLNGFREEAWAAALLKR
jgi:arsenate reductase (glutaredoxin)